MARGQYAWRCTGTAECVRQQPSCRGRAACRRVQPRGAGHARAGGAHDAVARTHEPIASRAERRRHATVFRPGRAAGPAGPADCIDRTECAARTASRDGRRYARARRRTDRCEWADARTAGDRRDRFGACAGRSPGHWRHAASIWRTRRSRSTGRAGNAGCSGAARCPGSTGRAWCTRSWRIWRVSVSPGTAGAVRRAASARSGGGGGRGGTARRTRRGAAGGAAARA